MLATLLLSVKVKVGKDLLTVEIIPCIKWSMLQHAFDRIVVCYPLCAGAVNIRTITWTNVDLSLGGGCAIHQTMTAMGMLIKAITRSHVTITYLKP